MPNHFGQSADTQAPEIPLAAQGPARYSLPRRTQSCPRRFPAAKRIVLFAAGAVLVAALAVARSLTPNSAGYGTHRQLGLPPCTLVELFGETCPSCGMTTAWSHLVRGQLREASAANLGGAILAVTALVAAPWLILSAACGRWLFVRPTEIRLIVYAAVLAAVIFLDWWVGIW
jgi:hypothetical protein